ncbi:MAG: pyridoxamine 5'-phosphate oxidase family protein [Candidatus Thiodiazotropha sp.]
MDLFKDWEAIRTLFKASLKSSFHFAIASVNEQGEPHVTPIGSLILDEPGRGYYFERFTQQLPKNLLHRQRVCVLAVNSGFGFWLGSLLRGRFAQPPGLRLYGTVSEPRAATEAERARWLRRVRPARFTRGHAMMWSEMDRVREIEFDRVDPVRIGKMTQGLYDL